MPKKARGVINDKEKKKKGELLLTPTGQMCASARRPCGRYHIRICRATKLIYRASSSSSSLSSSWVKKKNRLYNMNANYKDGRRGSLNN